MASGAGLGTFLPVAMVLFGILSILRARRARKDDTADTDAEARRASAAEMERRMAFYLAARDSDRGPPGPPGRNE
jgi:hypothetical protein